MRAPHPRGSGGPERRGRPRPQRPASRDSWHRDVLDSTQDGILVFERDAEGEFRVAFANAAFRRGYPRPLARLNGARVDDLLTGEALAAAREAHARAIAGRAPVLFEHGGGADQHWYSTLVSPRFDTGGSCHRLVLSIRDVTTLRRAEEELRHREATYRAVVEGSHDLIIVLDRGSDGVFRHAFANQAFYRVTAMTPESLAGTTVRDFLSDDAADIDEAKQREAVETGRPVVYEVERAFAGRRFLLLITVTPVTGLDLQVQRLVVTIRDASHLRRLQDAEARARHTRSLRALASGFSHRLNNALQAIRGNVALAANPAASEEERGLALAEIEAAAVRAATLVGALDAYAGIHDEDSHTCDALAVVSGEVERLRPLLPARVMVAFEAPAGLPPVAMGARALAQVVANLLANSAEVLDGEAGTIRVSAALEGGAPASAAGRVLIEVADTGPGIPAELGDRIFDPFVTTKFAGRGLGLATAQGLVSAHGGTLELVPAGPGATFRVILPTA